MRLALFTLWLSLSAGAQPFAFSDIAFLGNRGGGAASGCLIADSFQRGDWSDLGTQWRNIYGDTYPLFGISNNAASPLLSSHNEPAFFTNCPCSTASQYARITITTNLVPAYSYSGVILRGNPDSGNYYTVKLGWTEQTIDWYFATNNTPVFIQSTNLTWVSGDSLGVTVDGTGTSTIVRVWHCPSGDGPDSPSSWGGVGPYVAFTSDPASPIDSGNYVGIMSYVSGSDDVRLDNFTGGDCPAAAAWTPNDIAGLKAWWKADYYSLSDNTIISNVWATSGGPALDAYPSAPTNAAVGPRFRTNVQNGLPMITFTNVTPGQWFSFPSAPLLTNITTFVVFKIPANNIFGGYSGPLSWLTSSKGFLIVNEDAGTTAWTSHLYTPSADKKVTGLSYPVPSTIESWTAAGTNFTFERVGTNLTVSAGTAGWTAQTRIGYSYANWGGWIGEIIVYDSVLSSGDRATVTTYLKNRWGL